MGVFVGGGSGLGDGLLVAGIVAVADGGFWVSIGVLVALIPGVEVGMGVFGGPIVEVGMGVSGGLIVEVGVGVA